MEKWIPYHLRTTITETLQIIEDALANGFEFKVENHTLYFRERTDLSTYCG